MRTEDGYERKEQRRIPAAETVLQEKHWMLQKQHLRLIGLYSEVFLRELGEAQAVRHFEPGTRKGTLNELRSLSRVAVEASSESGPRARRSAVRTHALV